MRLLTHHIGDGLIPLDASGPLIAFFFNLLDLRLIREPLRGHEADRHSRQRRGVDRDDRRFHVLTFWEQAFWNKKVSQ